MENQIIYYFLLKYKYINSIFYSLFSTKLLKLLPKNEYNYINNIFSDQIVSTFHNNYKNSII